MPRIRPEIRPLLPAEILGLESPPAPAQRARRGQPRRRLALVSPDELVGHEGQCRRGGRGRRRGAAAGRLDQGRRSRRVIDGQVGQDLAVHRHALLGQRLDEAAVGDVVLRGRRR